MLGWGPGQFFNQPLPSALPLARFSMLSKIQSKLRDTVTITPAFKEFTDNEKSAGVFLMICSVAALALANSPLSDTYLGWWKVYLGPMNLSHWINDGLMAIFFLLIGLELKREVYVGELSDIKNATLPIVAALGGIAVPALIHFSFNRGLPTQSGFAIPMATDIAFVLSVLALAGDRVPLSLKVFLTAIAVIDDLCAIIVIALFYTADLNLAYLAGAGGVALLLAIINRLRVMSLIPYLLLGAVMWVFMYQSGIHATIAGVVLAFAFPFRSTIEGRESPMARLEHTLHKPVAFLILPIFAFANAGITIGGGALEGLMSPNGLGIMLGLLGGKLIGVSLASFLAVKAGLCLLPGAVRWRHVVGAGWLTGIGFTMSIFITNLAFEGNDALINTSKMAILLASFLAGLIGYFWLMSVGKNEVIRVETSE